MASLQSTSVTGTLSSTQTATFTGGLRAQELIEDVIDVTQTSNVVTLDYNLGNVFYFTGTQFSANYTVNIANAPATNGRAFVLTFIHTQGATGRRPQTLSIAGVPITLKWAGANAPTPTSSSGRVDVFSFTILYRGSAYESLVTSALDFG